MAVSTIINRINEETRRAQSALPGYELFGISASLREVFQIGNEDQDADGIKSEKYKLPGPIWGYENIKHTLEHLEGYEGSKLVYGTSFCRADSKEVVQLIAAAKALGLKQVTYFIDTESHTLEELVLAYARDYNLNPEDIYLAILGYVPKSNDKIIALPPGRNKPPSVSALEQLNLPPKVKSLWVESAKSLEGIKDANFGDWIVLITQKQVDEVAEFLGYAGKVKIEKFRQVKQITDAKDLTIKQIETYFDEHVLPYYRKYAFLSKASEEAVSTAATTGLDESLLPPTYSLAEPTILKFVNAPKGTRIYITCRGNVVIYDENQTPIQAGEDPTYKEFLEIAEKVKGQTILYALEQYPLQPSGLGYYFILGQALKNAALIMDNYERAIGPAAIAAALYETHRFYTAAMPKTLIGIDGDFDNPPDLGLLTILDEDGRKNLLRVCSLAQNLIQTDDPSTFAGIDISYNPKTKTASAELSIANRHLAIKLQKLLEETKQSLRSHLPSEPIIPPHTPKTSAFWFELYLNRPIKPIGDYLEIPMVGKPLLSPMAQIAVSIALGPLTPEFAEALGVEKEQVLIHEFLQAVNNIKSEINTAIQELEERSALLHKKIEMSEQTSRANYTLAVLTVCKDQHPDIYQRVMEKNPDITKGDDLGIVSMVAVCYEEEAENQLKVEAGFTQEERAELEKKEREIREYNEDAKRLSWCEAIKAVQNATGISSYQSFCQAIETYGLQTDITNIANVIKSLHESGARQIPPDFYSIKLESGRTIAQTLELIGAQPEIKDFILTSPRNLERALEAYKNGVRNENEMLQTISAKYQEPNQPEKAPNIKRLKQEINKRLEAARVERLVIILQKYKPNIRPSPQQTLRELNNHYTQIVQLRASEIAREKFLNQVYAVWNNLNAQAFGANTKEEEEKIKQIKGVEIAGWEEIKEKCAKAAKKLQEMAEELSEIVGPYTSRWMTAVEQALSEGLSLQELEN